MVCKNNKIMGMIAINNDDVSIIIYDVTKKSLHVVFYMTEIFCVKYGKSYNDFYNLRK